jgi:tRNA (guanine37-N1)-methyltransferase
MSWEARILTLFPDMFPGPLGDSLAGKALVEGRWAIRTVNMRDYAVDRYGAVDDAPFGGGPGMVMRPDVVDAALEAVKDAAGPLVHLTPRGRVLNQEMVRDFAGAPGVTLLCGRYEGIDERVIEAHDFLEVSLGDFVLSGGEPAAIVLIDACVRLLPGVMGAEASREEESFESGLLEYPQYTRPADWCGHRVPEVLLSGHHANIRAWRREQSEHVTRERRPDLWSRYAAQM